MFGFLKEKLKGALQRFTKGVDEKAKTEEVKEVVEKKAKPLVIIKRSKRPRIE